MNFKKYFVGTDPHVKMKDGKICGVDLITNNAVVKFLEDEGPWDGIVNAGDNFDFNLISHHNLGNLRAVRGEDLEGQYRAGNAYMTQHATAAGIIGNRKPYYLIEGNHEYRVERLINAQPQFEGLLEVRRRIPKFVHWVPFWSQHEILQIGKASFIHGMTTTQYHTAANLRKYGRNIFYGHTHDMVSSALCYEGADDTKIAQSMGCLCDYKQDYLKGSPTKWQQGFCVFHFWPDGKFNYFNVMIFDHAFLSPSGKWYDGKKMRPQTKLILE